MRALKHDMKNHLMAMDQYDHASGRERYREQLLESLEDHEYCRTGNFEIDSVINYKWKT